MTRITLRTAEALGTLLDELTAATEALAETIEELQDDSLERDDRDTISTTAVEQLVELERAWFRLDARSKRVRGG